MRIQVERTEDTDTKKPLLLIKLFEKDRFDGDDLVAKFLLTLRATEHLRDALTKHLVTINAEEQRKAKK